MFSVELLLRLHKIVREAYPNGVASGHIQRGKLEQIAERPFIKIHNYMPYQTVFEQAACLMEGIIRLHPFPDGNKRTALLTACIFLENNDRYLVAPLDAIRFMVEVAKNMAQKDSDIEELIKHIAQWLEKRTVTNQKEYEFIFSKYIRRPARWINFLTKIRIGIPIANLLLTRWFVIKMHPKYGKGMVTTTKFLNEMTEHTTKSMFKV